MDLDIIFAVKVHKGTDMKIQFFCDRINCAKIFLPDIIPMLKLLN